MKSIVVLFWNKRTSLEKFFIVLLFLAFLYGSVATIQKGIYKYRYFKSIEKEYNTAKDSIAALNIRIGDLTQKQQNKVNASRKRSQTINDKLKQDEKAIDSKPVTDAELDEFLSRYDN